MLTSLMLFIIVEASWVDRVVALQFFLTFNAFIWSFHLYKYKFKEKTINNDKCFIQLWLMPLLGLLIILTTVKCTVFKIIKFSYG